MIEILESSWLAVLLHGLIIVSVGVRIVMKRPATGVALAWLLLVTAIPGLGLVLYLLFGERRIGRRRAERIGALRTGVSRWIEGLVSDGVTSVDWNRHSPACQRMNRLGRASVGVPTLVGNDLLFVSDTDAILKEIATEIDNAKSTVHMMFYIWHPGGLADEVVEALLRANERGVRCRVLVDALGSATWWKGELRKRLQSAGVEVVRAMPTGILRAITARNDLRLHRKIVVVDGEVAWTGSMNLVDPKFFKQDAGVGQWVDAMVRVKGPAVEALLAVLLSDWQLETGQPIQEIVDTSDLKRLKPVGTSDVQVIPSGPGQSIAEDAILQMILNMIYAASEEILITTPYFIPDDSMLRAIRGAAARGVRVELIVPAKVDSMMVRYASRSYFDDLLEAGVTIQQFDGGLLHTKSITVDGAIAMFGTVNLDMRSLFLNYEVSLFVYDEACGAKVRELQQSYLQDCHPVDREQWLKRSPGVRFVENVFRLVSPLL
jgi:cardiolipin synthase